MRRYFISAMIALLSLGLVSRAGNCDDTSMRIKGIGDFADPGLHSTILGTAVLGNKDGADIFLKRDNYYGGTLFHYVFDSFNDGLPVFKLKGEFSAPKAMSDQSRVFGIGDKVIAFWKESGSLKWGYFNPKKEEFTEEGSLVLPKMKYGMSSFTVDFLEDGGLDIYFSGKTVSEKEKRPAWRTAEYRPYDATGVWTGGHNYFSLFTFHYDSLKQGTPSEVRMIADTLELMTGSMSVDMLELGGQKGILASSSNGGFYFYCSDSNGKFHRTRIVGDDGNALRSPAISPAVRSFVCRPSGKLTFITSGEGGVFCYNWTGKKTGEGKFVFDQPRNAQEINPPVFAGSLIVPTIVDWDKDGVLDVVCGNSAGYILFYKNVGTNEKPSLINGRYIYAGGKKIHIQPGYGEDIQGPGESRWGYVCPNVIDWNNDGYLDIVCGDSRSKHSVFIGTPDGLEPEHPIYLDDLPLHGMWRCRPGVGDMAGRRVYITLDDDDEFHLYFREDDYNLNAGYKLKLSDGRKIKANWLEAGGKGRVKFEVVDWDGDGVKDLIIATNKHNQIPADDPHGLPWTNPKELKGSTILFMRNAGTEEEPVFEFPKQLKYKGKLIILGHHACGASAGMLGHITDGLPNIVAGDERGHLYLFERQYLSW